MDLDQLLQAVRVQRELNHAGHAVAIELGPNVRASVEASIGGGPLVQVDGLHVVPVDDGDHVNLLFDEA